MKPFALAILLFSPPIGFADEAEDSSQDFWNGSKPSALIPHFEDKSIHASQRYWVLQQQAVSINRNSSQEEVLSALGEPLRRADGGWGAPNAIVWTYLDYLDEEQSILVEVWFEEDRGCLFHAQHLVRHQLEQGLKRIDSGTLTEFWWDRPNDKRGRLIGIVQFDQEFAIAFSVENLDRVKGIPRKGAQIQIEHFGAINYLYFEGRHALYLKSIEILTGKDEGNRGPALVP